MIKNIEPDDLSLLPVEPEPEQLLEAYLQCRSQLIAANKSLRSLKGHDTRRRKLLVDLRQQLNELEASFLEETQARRSVHELNLRIASIIKDLEDGLNQAAAIVEEPSGAGLTEWTVRIARLVQIASRLWQVRTRALSFLRQAESVTQSEPLQPLPGNEDPASVLPSQPEIAQKRYGPLLLKNLDYAYGLVVMHSDGMTIPSGFIVERNWEFLPNQPLLAPQDPEDPQFAPVEAALQVVSEAAVDLPVLNAWLIRGVLPFANDERIGELHLIDLDNYSEATHVLVREEEAHCFEEIGSAKLPLDLDSHDWLGFILETDDDREALRLLLRRAGEARQLGPRLSNRGGVRLPENQGYLATGLGLPLLRAPQAMHVTAVQLQLSDGEILLYERESHQDKSDQRIDWKPTVAVRRQAQLRSGSARFLATLANGQNLERAIQLSSLPQRVRFYRAQPLEFREDWGLGLGPLALPPQGGDYAPASAEAMQWAQQRLSQGELTVNHLFEQQMLEGLSAIFQRRSSLLRHEFFGLYAQLRNKEDEWPLFPEAVLRGWCEGGWLEEGLERGNGHWRVQVVDARLVRLASNSVQLVGLLSARGLMHLIAMAHQLGLRVQAVPPACADMPRGWRFHGEISALAAATALPIVEQAEWVSDPAQISWSSVQQVNSDCQHWPRGLRTRQSADAICGRRGMLYHWKPKNAFPERGRAPVTLTITAETSRYGKRRWHSRDPDTEAVLTSCHRNRVALHALAMATDGLWPFAYTDIGVIDRLYDADVYLPLPLARFAALTGNRMPGPTRLRPEEHTYRYTMARANNEGLDLPLTPLP